MEFVFPSAVAVSSIRRLGHLFAHRLYQPWHCRSIPGFGFRRNGLVEERRFGTNGGPQTVRLDLFYGVCKGVCNRKLPHTWTQRPQPTAQHRPCNCRIAKITEIRNPFSSTLKNPKSVLRTEPALLKIRNRNSYHRFSWLYYTNFTWILQDSTVRCELHSRTIEDYPPRAPIFVKTERYTFFFSYTFSECPPGSKTAVLNWLSTHTKK